MSRRQKRDEEDTTQGEGGTAILDSEEGDEGEGGGPRGAGMLGTAPTSFARAETAIGYVKRLMYGDASGVGVTNTVWGTVDLHLPERELGKAELTNDDSPDFHKDYLPSLYEPGTVSGSYRYTKTMFAEFEALFQRNTVAANRASGASTPGIMFWKVVFPNGTPSTATFQGFITKNNLPMEIENVMTCEFEIQVIGKITYTA